MSLPKLGLRSLMAIAHAVRRHGDVGPARDRKRMSRSSGMLKGTPALLLVFLALSLAVFAVFAKPASSRQQSSLGERAQAGAVISTDRQVYLAGETVNVFGSGFSPYERVGLRVTHANGNTEANMGHEMWWADADFDGTFKAAWTVNSNDSAGTGFIIEAEGSSGSTPRAMFVRGAVISTDGSSYQSGEKARITARGFNPGERVNIAVQDGRNRAPLSRLADENGQVRAQVELPADKPAAGFVTIQAMATQSGVMSSMTIPYTFFSVTDQQGANDQPAQSDLTHMGRDNSDPYYYKIFWSWDSIDQWTGTGSTGDACALFDSDGDGKVNYAVCGQITNQNANPNVVVQTTGSPFAFSCNNARTDRCGSPTSKSFTSTDIQAGPLPGSTASPAGNLITDTDPFGPTALNGPGSNYPSDATLYMRIRKAFLPANSALVNVCSYPSAGSGGNNNPFDCIVSPGGGLLVIKKVANGITTTNFNFLVSPVPSPEPSNYTITGSGYTPAIGVAIGNSSETVTETVPQNWNLTGASCALEGGGSTGYFDSANHKVTGITIESGKTTTCTFTNTENIPKISLTKSASSTSYNAVGQVITYTYKITNTGNVTLAGPFSVSDNKQPAVSCPTGSLVPGASITCTSTRTINQADIDAGSITNTATASGNGVTSNQASATVTAVQTKALTLAKSASPTTYSKVGQTITYTYTVTNSGNTTLSGPFSVTDNKQGTISPCGSGPLAPAAQTTCTSTYTITQTDIDYGSVTNTATASGNGLTSNSATATVTATQAPALTLVKSANRTIYDTAGQMITYTYVITNSGNTTMAGPFTVTDNQQGTISCGTGPLAPGAQTTCTSTYTITQADIDFGSITNTATASFGTITSNTASVTVRANRTMSVDLVKTATPNFSSPPVAGDTINYNFKITNTGTVTLTGVVLTDASLNEYASGGFCNAVTTLDPGKSTTCSGTYTVQASDISGGHVSVTNGAQACGNPPSGSPVCDSSNVRALQ